MSSPLAPPPPAAPHAPAQSVPSGDARPGAAIEALRPPELFLELSRSVLGQDQVVRQLALAVHKHVTGKVSGNMLLIGNSGTGKTTLMGSLQRLYRERPEYRDFRAVAVLNANLLVDAERLEFRPDRLLEAVAQRARLAIGHPASAAELKAAVERATVCLDEIDKMSTRLGGRPNPAGIVLQQGLLTLMEGGHVPLRARVVENGREELRTLEIETGRMMFICGGAFEELYDQVYQRVTSPTAGEKLSSSLVRGPDGRFRIESRFALADFFRLEDLFAYGMTPQFAARFDSVALLADLSATTLKEILLSALESPFRRSQRYFEGMGIRLELEDGAAALIADEAARHLRLGARALREVFGRIAGPLEYDPWNSGAVLPSEDGSLILVIDAAMVRRALGLAPAP